MSVKPGVTVDIVGIGEPVVTTDIMPGPPVMSRTSAQVMPPKVIGAAGPAEGRGPEYARESMTDAKPGGAIVAAIRVPSLGAQPMRAAPVLCGGRKVRGRHQMTAIVR